MQNETCTFSIAVRKSKKKKCFPKLHAKYAFLLFQMKLQLLI